MHEPIDEETRSNLEILAGMHQEPTGLLPASAMSIVLWVDEAGNEKTTIFVAQTMSGVTAVGLCAQAQYILCHELLEHDDG